MELLQLHYFLDVAQTQHVTRSAERLHVAQPAVTQAIHRLEKEFGVPLLRARGRNITLTEYGVYLRDRLLPVADTLERLPDELQTLAALHSAIIHLNVLAASMLVTEAIIEYTRQETGVEFRVMQNSESELYDIRITTQLPGGKDEAVCTEPIYMAVPNTPRYQALQSIRLGELRDERFISLQGSKQLRWICDSFCHQAGFSPHIIFESDSPAAVRNMIAARLGIGFWPAFTWGRLESDQVRLLPIEEPACARELVLTCKANKPDSRETQRFYEFLSAYLAAAVHSEAPERTADDFDR